MIGYFESSCTDLGCEVGIPLDESKECSEFEDPGRLTLRSHAVVASYFKLAVFGSGL